MRNLILLATATSVIGCSSLSYKQKTLSYMTGAFAVGAVAGAMESSDSDNSSMHGLLWGSVAAAAIGAVMVAKYDESSEIKKKEYEVRELEARLADFKRNTKIVPKNGETTFMESNLPKDVRHLVAPGKWKLFQIDEWKKSSDGEYVHQDQLLEITPAKVTIEQ